MNMIEPHWRDEPTASVFTPTQFMDKIVDKLSGIPCYTSADAECKSELIGEVCDDGNEYTINDRYNEYCHCIGNFTSELQSTSTDAALLIYPVPVSSHQDVWIETFKIDESGQISVFNSMGERVLIKDMSNNDEKVSINMSQLPEGLYWASFHTSQKVFATKAFVK